MSDSVQKYSASRMGSAPIGPLLLSCSVPMMISMLVQALYNIVDSIFVSRVNEAALSAVSLAFPIQNLMIAFAVGTAVGVNAYLSRCLGEGNRAEASRAAMNGLFLAFCGGIAFLVFGILGARAFIASQTTDAQIMQYGADYLSICTLWCMGLFLQCMLEKLLVATGRSAFAMASQLIGALVNIALDPIFIFTLGMGAGGAALATVLGYVLSDVLLVCYILRKSRHLTVSIRHARVARKFVTSVFVIGIPASLTNLMQSYNIMVLNRHLISYGPKAVAAMGITMKVNMIIMMILVGFAFGAQPLIGYAYGAGNRSRLRAVIRFDLLVEVGFSAVASVVVIVLAPQLIGMFMNDASVVSYGTGMLRWFTLTTPFCGIVLVLTTCFIAMGKAVPSFVLSISRQGVIFTVVILITAACFGYDGIICAQPVADFLTAVVGIFMYAAARKSDQTLRKED